MTLVFLALSCGLLEACGNVRRIVYTTDDAAKRNGRDQVAVSSDEVEPIAQFRSASDHPRTAPDLLRPRVG